MKIWWDVVGQTRGLASLLSLLLVSCHWLCLSVIAAPPVTHHVGSQQCPCLHSCGATPVLKLLDSVSILLISS